VFRDTAGQERFRSVCKSYYRGALGCLLVYDVNSRDSYNSLSAWLQDARELARPDITVAVVGNQIDRATSEREVPALEAGRFAQEHDCLFMESSAASGLNVDSIFEVLCGRIVHKIVSGQIDENSMMKDVHPGVAGKAEEVQQQAGYCGKC